MNIEEIIHQLEESLELEDWDLVEAVIEKLRESNFNSEDYYEENELDW
jgi:hypothetical protein